MRKIIAIALLGLLAASTIPADVARAQPAVSKPGMSQPGMSQPGMSQPGAPVRDAPTAAADKVMALPGGGDTRAILVLHAGKPVVELYGRGYSAETRFLSWSMAKTVTAIALGMFVDAGTLALDQPAPVARWQAANDPRAKITLRQLVTMISGLEHQEGTEGGKPIESADTPRMLFTSGAADTFAYAAAKPLAHPPGAVWKYSTATTQILAEIASRHMTTATNPAERRRATAAWFETRLWQPLGITSAVWDFDAAGLFLGSSMLHMTTRDWGRLGQFLLDRGVAADGKRLVSQAWLDEMLKPATANSGNYAGQLWLNTQPAAHQPSVLFHPRGTPDMYAMSGHLGQYVVVAPDKRAVLVRLGKSTGTERRVMMPALADILDRLPASAPTR